MSRALALRTRSGITRNRLTNDQTEGMQRVVASVVQGLKPDAVMVVAGLIGRWIDEDRA